MTERRSHFSQTMRTVSPGWSLSLMEPVMQQGYRAVKDSISLSSRFPADPVWFWSPAISIVRLIRFGGSQLKAMRWCWVWSFTLVIRFPVRAEACPYLGVSEAELAYDFRRDALLTLLSGRN